MMIQRGAIKTSIKTGFFSLVCSLVYHYILIDTDQKLEVFKTKFSKLRSLSLTNVQSFHSSYLIAMFSFVLSYIECVDICIGFSEIEPKYIESWHTLDIILFAWFFVHDCRVKVNIDSFLPDSDLELTDLLPLVASINFESSQYY